MNEFESNQKSAAEVKIGDQEAVLLELNRLNLNFYLFGGWAGKVDGVFGDEYCPSDIDVLIQDSDGEKLGETLRTMGFAVEDVPQLSKKIATRGDVVVDIHFVKEKGGYLTEETPHGTFHFPADGFDSRDWKGSNFKVMSPELSTIIEAGGPPRDGKEQKLERLGMKTDASRMKSLSQTFKYERTQGQ